MNKSRPRLHTRRGRLSALFAFVHGRRPLIEDHPHCPGSSHKARQVGAEGCRDGIAGLDDARRAIPYKATAAMIRGTSMVKNNSMPTPSTPGRRA